MIAVSHPGKIGDSLYALPTCKYLAEQYGERVDFYTSSYCEPMRPLVEYQPYINRMVVPAEYHVERMDLGVQPWYMPIDESQYTQVHQLGFRSVPDRALHQFMALNAGIDKSLKVWYDCPYIGNTMDYFCIAPRGSSDYAKLFYDVGKRISQLGYGVAVIGGASENIFEVPEISDPLIFDYTGTDFLTTTSIIAESMGFVGLMSSQLVLANGFDVPKVAVHDGIHWDLRHVIYSDTNFYPINPSVEEVVALLGL